MHFQRAYNLLWLIWLEWESSQLCQVNLPPSLELVCVNIDAQTMVATSSHSRIQIGQQTTRSLGTGLNPMSVVR